MAKQPKKKKIRLKRPDLQTIPGTTYKFDLVGNIPSKKNRVRFGSHGAYHDKKFSDWHKDAVLQLTPHVPEGGWISKCVTVEITFVFETLRVKDLTNAAESLMDLLVDVGILKDDNFKVVPRLILSASYIKDMSVARVEIKV